jgi:hypothetical protein
MGSGSRSVYVFHRSMAIAGDYACASALPSLSILWRRFTRGSTEQKQTISFPYRYERVRPEFCRSCAHCCCLTPLGVREEPTNMKTFIVLGAVVVLGGMTLNHLARATSVSADSVQRNEQRTHEDRTGPPHDGHGRQQRSQRRPNPPGSTRPGNNPPNGTPGVQPEHGTPTSYRITTNCTPSPAIRWTLFPRLVLEEVGEPSSSACPPLRVL